MMYPFPFSSFPNFRRNYYSGYHNYALNNLANRPSPYFPKISSASSNTSCHTSSFQQIPRSKQENPKTNCSKHPQETNSCSSACQEEVSEEKPIFEIFGIRLYSDDLILLALLFFLYKEEVKDPSLFISLILLLLS